MSSTEVPLCEGYALYIAALSPQLMVFLSITHRRSASSYLMIVSTTRDPYPDDPMRDGLTLLYMQKGMQ